MKLITYSTEGKTTKKSTSLYISQRDSGFNQHFTSNCGVCTGNMYVFLIQRQYLNGKIMSGVYQLRGYRFIISGVDVPIVLFNDK